MSISLHKAKALFLAPLFIIMGLLLLRPVPASAADRVPSYGDFIAYLSKVPEYNAADKNYWLAAYGYNASSGADKANAYRMSITVGASYTTSNVGTYRSDINFGGNYMSITLICQGYSDEGFNIYAVTSKTAGVQYRYESGYMYASFPGQSYDFPTNRSNYYGLELVTNVDFTPDIIINNYPTYQQWYTVLPSTTSPESSRDTIDPPPPTEPPSGGGGSFELPPDWVDDTPLPTEKPIDMDWMPDQTAVDGALNAFTGVLDTISDFADTFGFWIHYMGEFISVTDLIPYVLLLIALGMFVYLLWHI